MPVTTIARIAKRIGRADRTPASTLRFEIADVLARVNAEIARRAA